MILYKSKDWFSSIWYFHNGPTARRLFGRLVWVFVYVSVITVLQLYFVNIRLIDTPGTFIGTMGILLSLLLIFRTNTAYDRFYEGRTAWGMLVNNCRNLALYFNAVLLPEQQQERLFFTKMISNFPFSLKNHLRDQAGDDELEFTDSAERDELDLFDHQPAGLTSLIWNRSEALYRQGFVTESQHINLNERLTTLMDVCGICERIKSTPIPFSYNLFIKLFILAYVAVLPFTLIQAFGVLTVPVVVFTSYILVGLESIGEEIEEPFGLDRNDLPLNQLSQLIRVNVHDILLIHLPKKEKEAAKPGFVVVT